MEDSFIGSTFKTPKGGTLTVVDVCGRSGTTKIYSISCSICEKDVELFPELFVSGKRELTNGIVPCGCSKKPHWGEKQIIVKLTRLCNDIGYKFIGFPNGYVNSKSKFEYVCNTHTDVHQVVTCNNFFNGTRCNLCGVDSQIKKRKNKHVDDVVSEICNDIGYKFIGFPNGYKNGRSKFEYICHTHKFIQTTTYKNFVSNGTRCPVCSKTGYDPSRSGYFYIFKYKISNLPIIYKYGITNRDPLTRSKEHISGLKPSSIEISELVYSREYNDGFIPMFMERDIKSKYNGVCDWLTSGNTETVYEKDYTLIIENIRKIDYADELHQRV